MVSVYSRHHITTDSIICLYPNTALLRVNNFNVGVGVATGANIKSVGGLGMYASSLVVDPDRKLLFPLAIRTSLRRMQEPCTRGYFYVDTRDHARLDFFSGGCGDLMGYAYPSLVWDPALHRIVGYVPRSRASGAGNNEVIIFDPGEKTCVLQPISGGPLASGAILGPASAEQGMFGRFAYFPALGKYLVVNNAATNAATFT